MTDEKIFFCFVDPITEEAMVTFSAKNIQVGHPENTNNEKKFDGRKKIYFFLF